MAARMFFEQRLIGMMANFGYLIGDPEAKVAAVVDPSFDARVLQKVAAENGDAVELILNTHPDPDHALGKRPPPPRASGRCPPPCAPRSGRWPAPPPCARPQTRAPPRPRRSATRRRRIT